MPIPEIGDAELWAVLLLVAMVMVFIVLAGVVLGFAYIVCPFLRKMRRPPSRPDPMNDPCWCKSFPCECGLWR